MAFTLNSAGWDMRRASATRGAGAVVAGVPPEFLTCAKDTEEFVAQPRPAARGAAAVPGALDVSYDLPPGEAAVLAVRHPSGALTFHAPRIATSRTRGGPTEVRFIVPIRSDLTGTEPAATRGVVSKALKAVIVKFGGASVYAAAGFVLSKLAERFEASQWKKRGLKEGWLKVTKQGLAERRLNAGKPSSTERSLLLVHGTFSDAASAYASLAKSSFFEDVKPLYDDRVFAFNHFSLSRTPEQNARLLLEELPDKTFTFDVITHSRGGLVLRNLVERSAAFGPLASRFALGRAILVASPNEGTPLATPSRWEDTVGWLANLLELFPDNPFTTGAEFVANGLEWMAKHASGDLPGLHAMDGDGDLIRELQSPPGPPADKYSVLTSNYTPSGSVLNRLLDVGLDQFFNTANDLVVPSEGGWRVDPSGGRFIPGARIGCFGPGGNIERSDVTHVNVFAQPETVSFLVAALSDRPHKLALLDPAQRLPDRRLIRSGAAGVAAPAAAAAGRPAAAKRDRFTGRAERAAPAEAEAMLGITVVNGDVTFEGSPLLVGHYRSTRLTGAEAALDKLLDRSMSNALDLGVYPVEPGTNRIFINRRPRGFWQTPRPAAVIVVGLGQEGKLQSSQIVLSVRQAVIAWAEREAERPRTNGLMTLAATLLASGGTDVTPGQAAQLIAQGVFDANALIRRASARHRLPEVRELRFIEMYLSRATEGWEALKMLAEAMPTRYRVTEPIVTGMGWIRRPLYSGYRGADYDFITAETRRDLKGNMSIAYALDTQRARTEVRAQATQAQLVRDLVTTASSDTGDGQQTIGRTLYKLLVPIELEAFLAGSHETQIEVDEGTAGIPWELLDDADPERPQQPPWAIRSKLLRKYRTETFRSHVNDTSAQASVLVIGEPHCPPEYPPLPGALQEAKDVFEVLTSERGLERDCVKGLFAGDQLQHGPDARQVVDTLFDRSWRVVHIAGHGELFDDKRNRGGGVVLSNDTFLGASEIKAMRAVPELVFVNCCHLAASSRRSLLQSPAAGLSNRAAFASSIAQALIDIGVRCVIAAGWAVDDQAASAFATTFYDALLRGERFIDAVAHARAKAFEFEGHTWAAYQCYGDPDWKLTGRGGWEQTTRKAPEDEFDHIGSTTALELALETLVVQSTFQGYSAEYQLERVKNLEKRWQKMQWDASNELASLFGQAYSAAGDLASTIRWYETAVEKSGGDVSFRTLEQLSNIRIRHAFEVVTGLKAELQRQATTAAAAGARKRLRKAIASARSTIKDEMTLLEQLTEFQETSERQNLRGSAMKRLAMLEAGEGRAAVARRAVKAMARYYGQGLKIGRERGASGLFYPATNLMAAEIFLNAGSARSKALSAKLVAEARASLEKKNASRPDFWSLIAEAEIQLYEAIARGNLPARRSAIERAFKDVFKRSQGSMQWRSVLDTTRFVLEPYLARAKPKATKAAAGVLDLIESFVSAKPSNS
jgi:CHAT domain-containing protein